MNAETPPPKWLVVSVVYKPMDYVPNIKVFYSLLAVSYLFCLLAGFDLLAAKGGYVLPLVIGIFTFHGLATYFGKIPVRRVSLLQVGKDNYLNTRIKGRSYALKTMKQGDLVSVEPDDEIGFHRLVTLWPAVKAQSQES